jgi:hypothetical protein
VSRFENHESNVDLAPIFPSFVSQLVEHLSYMMVAIVADEVVVGPLKFFICLVDGVVPFVGRVICMVEYEILEGTAEGQLTTMHGPHSHKVIDGSIRFADSSVANARQAASNAR